MPPRLDIPCDELRALYESGQSSQALGQHYRCSPTTITKYLRRCGVAVRASRFAAKAVPPDELRRLYEEERWPISRIAAHFGVSVSTITNVRRRWGVGTRARRQLLETDSAMDA